MKLRGEKEMNETGIEALRIVRVLKRLHALRHSVSLNYYSM
jgi:hypothetical protein